MGDKCVTENPEGESKETVAYGDVFIKDNLVVSHCIFLSGCISRYLTHARPLVPNHSFTRSLPSYNT